MTFFFRFAEDENLFPGKLHRTPTPFPKELRPPNRKHCRNDEVKPNDNYVNVVDGRVKEQGTYNRETTSAFLSDSLPPVLSFPESEFLLNNFSSASELKAVILKALLIFNGSKIRHALFYFSLKYIAASESSQRYNKMHKVTDSNSCGREVSNF